MLDYELFDYFDNQIMNPKMFLEKVKKRMRMNEDFDVKKFDPNVNCPICF